MSDSDVTPATRPGRGSSALLGLTTALVFCALPRGLLLPAVDRTLPGTVGLGVVAALFSLGLLSAGAAGRTTRRLWLCSAALLAGGLLSAELVAWLRPALAVWIVQPFHYHGLIALTSAAVAAPIVVPLGLVAGLPLRSGGSPLAALLLGAAAGFAAGPVLCEWLLGWSVTVQACALLGAGSALLLARVAPLRATGTRLVQGSGWGLLLLGPVAFGAWRQVVGAADLGTLGGPWLAAVVCMGAAITVHRPPRLSLPLMVAALALVLPLLSVPLDAVAADTSATPARSFWILAGLGLPVGVLLGALLGHRGAGVRVGWMPLLLVLLVPATLWLLLPRFGVRGTSWALALVALAGALSTRSAVAGTREVVVAVVVLAGLSIAGLGRPTPADRTTAESAWQTPEGPAAVVVDAATGTRQLAVDGVAPFGVHAMHQRRLAHLPLLLHGAPADVLLVASSQGQEARAALDHELDSLVWLEPFSNRRALIDTTRHGTYVVRKTGSERLILAGRPDRYDVIVMALDPRGERRAAQVGTVEFFRLAESRLTEGGLLCQWWDPWRTDIDEIKAVVSSALQAFDHVYLMMDHPRSRRVSLGLIGSRQPLAIRVQHIEDTLLQRPAVHADMERVGLSSVMIGCLVMGGRGVLDLLAPSKDALYDDRPVVGARGALRRLLDGRQPAKAFPTLAKRRSDPRPWIVFPGGDEAGRLWSRAQDAYEGWGELLGGTQAVVDELGLASPAFEGEAPGTGPLVEGPAFVAALPRLHDWPYLDGLVLGHASHLERDGRLAACEQYLRDAVAAKDWSPQVRYALARIVELRGDAEDALDLYDTVLAFDPDHPEALRALDRLRGG